MHFPTRTVNLFLVWILFSLLAIAYIGQRPYLGLAIAIIGGIALGTLSFLYYQEGVTEQEQQEPAETDTQTNDSEDSIGHSEA